MVDLHNELPHFARLDRFAPTTRKLSKIVRVSSNTTPPPAGGPTVPDLFIFLYIQ